MNLTIKELRTMVDLAEMDAGDAFAAYDDAAGVYNDAVATLSDARDALAIAKEESK